MRESDTGFTGSIPENYERYMVPLIFRPYAEDLARRAAELSPAEVLEIAAGTGVVTRSLAPLLAPDAHYLVTDLNQPMLDFAASIQPEDSRVEWHRADAQELPFPDNAFDIVCCQFGAMFFPDRERAYREFRRVLRPGGHLLLSVWDRIEANVFAHEVTNALAEMFPNDPPRFLARTPYGYGDRELIRRELYAAGFRRPEVETIAEESIADSPRTPAVAFCQGTVLRTEILERDPLGLGPATDHAAAVIARLHGDREVRARIQAHVVDAVA